jgi:hypothetical protein
MWLITPIGFYSIICKPGDAEAETLTVRARVKSDLEALRQEYLPSLGTISERRGHRLSLQSESKAQRGRNDDAMARHP